MIVFNPTQETVSSWSYMLHLDRHTVMPPPSQ